MLRFAFSHGKDIKSHSCCEFNLVLWEKKPVNMNFYENTRKSDRTFVQQSVTVSNASDNSRNVSKLQ